MNGKPWNSTALPHRLLASGGTLDFTMGDRPSAWGTGAHAAPTSLTQDDKVPSPPGDVTGPGGGPLFDNTSDSAAERPAPRWTSPGPPGSRRTPSPRRTVPRHRPAGRWRAPGTASGGRGWTDREGESFTWNRQTRVFAIDRPGSYPHYRLVPDGKGTLAEIELLGTP